MSSAPEERDDGQRSVEDRPDHEVRAPGYAAFSDEPDIDVLDLEFDSVVDSPDGLTSEVRHLRFAGHGCVVDVDVRGSQQRIIDVRVSHPGSVKIELRTKGRHGSSSVPWRTGLTLTAPDPQLTSFYLRWPKSSRGPARTAWVPL